MSQVICTRSFVWSREDAFPNYPVFAGPDLSSEDWPWPGPWPTLRRSSVFLRLYVLAAAGDPSPFRHLKLPHRISFSAQPAAPETAAFRESVRQGSRPCF